MIVRPVLALILCLSVAALGSGCASRGAFESTQDIPVEGAPAPAAAPAEAAATIAADSAAAPAAATVAPSSTAARALDASAGFRIGAEDVLDIQVWKNCTELCRTVPVRPDGMVSFPLVHDIQAAGLTAAELRQQLTRRLAEFIPSPEVSVIVREVHSVKVSVVGAVRMPGHYEVNSAATVLDLIARAQGLTEFANRDRIVVHRQNGGTATRLPFDYSRVADGKDENFFVQPGDIIVVP
ncbi:MAG TPA: polysaccharide biosynthesis/export family protein [Vicinamibacterales bacterium]